MRGFGLNNVFSTLSYSIQFSSVQTSAKNIEFSKKKSDFQKYQNEMIEDSQSVRCKYFNTGYCKFEDECSYKHPKEICLLHVCQDKICIKIHPKACRFKAHCKRRSSCMYRHSKYESVNTEEEIDRLKEQIVMLQKSNTENITY